MSTALRNGSHFVSELLPPTAAYEQTILQLQVLHESPAGLQYRRYTCQSTRMAFKGRERQRTGQLVTYQSVNGTRLAVELAKR